MQEQKRRSGWLPHTVQFQVVVEMLVGEAAEKCLVWLVIEITVCSLFFFPLFFSHFHL